MALLEVRDLRVTFETANGSVRAVNDISFELRRGEILALVGESGSGKTVSSLSLSGLLPGNAETTGSVLLDGEEILGAPPRRLRQVRKRKIAYVFQDPMSSLNPARRIGSQLEEVLRVNTSMRRTAARERAIELLAHVGIPSPKRHLRSYPHQLSGGMSQRVMIAIALASEPALIIADEATSSLDVSIQGQILELLKRVREDFDTAMLVVTHDFGVVSGLADSIAVMYGGEIVESGPTEMVLSQPHHPYTAALMMSSPDTADRAGGALFTISGSLDEGHYYAGSRCQFAPRCPLVFDRCWEEWPKLSHRGPGHMAACFLEGNEVVKWQRRRGATQEPARP